MEVIWRDVKTPFHAVEVGGKCLSDFSTSSAGQQTYWRLGACSDSLKLRNFQFTLQNLQPTTPGCVFIHARVPYSNVGYTKR